MSNTIRICKKCQASITGDQWYSVPFYDIKEETGPGFYYSHYHIDCYLTRSMTIEYPELKEAKEDAISNA